MGSRTPSSVPGVFLDDHGSEPISIGEVVINYLRCVPREEVVAGLLRAEFADRRKDTESVASQHNDVVRMPVNNAWDLGPGNEIDGVCATSILGDANIIVVWNTREGIVNDVLENGTITNRRKNIGFLLGGQVDAFSIATALNVEDTRVGPYVLIVAN